MGLLISASAAPNAGWWGDHQHNATWPQIFTRLVFRSAEAMFQKSLEEKVMNLHCDNCSGQGKKSYALFDFMRYVMRGYGLRWPSKHHAAWPQQIHTRLVFQSAEAMFQKSKRLQLEWVMVIKHFHHRHRLFHLLYLSNINTWTSQCNAITFCSGK